MFSPLPTVQVEVAMLQLDDIIIKDKGQASTKGLLVKILLWSCLRGRWSAARMLFATQMETHWLTQLLMSTQRFCANSSARWFSSIVLKLKFSHRLKTVWPWRWWNCGIRQKIIISRHCHSPLDEGWLRFLHLVQRPEHRVAQLRTPSATILALNDQVRHRNGYDKLTATYCAHIQYCNCYTRYPDDVICLSVSISAWWINKPTIQFAKQKQ